MGILTGGRAIPTGGTEIPTGGNFKTLQAPKQGVFSVFFTS